MRVFESSLPSAAAWGRKFRNPARRCGGWWERWLEFPFSVVWRKAKALFAPRHEKEPNENTFWLKWKAPMIMMMIRAKRKWN